MKDYIYSDLAYEMTKDFLKDEFKEEIFLKNTKNEMKILRFEIKTEEDAQRCGKSCGRYITMMTPNLGALEEDTYFFIQARLSTEIRNSIRRYFDHGHSPQTPTILVVGIGNPEMTADALGPETVKQITANRHLKQTGIQNLSQRQEISVCTMIPGVLGSTGIETIESVSAIVDRIKPALVLAIDALSARHISSLAATIQVTDAGIAPGSGIGNLQKSLTRQTLGIPVIAVGVPMVVNSSTMIRDALEQGGMTSLSSNMKEILENGKSFFVTPKESDVILKSVSMLLAGAIDLACSSGGE